MRYLVLTDIHANLEALDACVADAGAYGYDATLVRVVRDGGTWYRVQVGRFADSGEATETMHRLREHEGVSAFVASE